MKKRILSILLAMVMVLSLTTACASNEPSSNGSPPQTNATTETTEETTEATTEETTESVPELKVTPLEWEILSLTQSEFLKLSSEQVALSCEDLCVEDCEEIGSNFEILMVGSIDHPVYSDEARKQISDDAYTAFLNIKQQAESKEFSRSYLGAWASVPHKSILQECYSNYDASLGYLYCNPIRLGHLSKQDALEVATTLLRCSDINTGCEGIFSCIGANNYPEVQEMALQKLVELSKTSKEYYTGSQLFFFQYFDGDTYLNEVLSEEKATEIRNNILKNRYFDFILKYSTFCNSKDEEIAKQAFDRLLEIAKSKPDEGTSGAIRVVAQKLWDVDKAGELLLALDS